MPAYNEEKMFVQIKKHQDNEDMIREIGNMKIKRIQGSSQMVIQSQGGSDQRAKPPMGRRGTEHFRLVKKLRNVTQGTDMDVLLNGMRIIKVKAVVKMIAVGKEGSKNNQNQNE